jgi:D-alanyl-D-alanine carboxypeptidase/D-alanyl-D-alanine-endopeptidase (penicillin-binding protein 4)
VTTLAFALTACVATACASAAPRRGAARAPRDPRATLAAAADSLMADTLWRNAHWGALVVNPRTGDTLYSRHAGKLFMPASNQKIVTGGAALALLGPDFRWRTALVADRGALAADGTLRGDLRIVGRGDPTVSDRAQGDALRPLRALADSLRARGVRRVDGRLVAAGDAFPGDPLGYGWAWDDLDEPYSAGVAELLFNEGLARVVVRGGERPGDPVAVTVGPAPSALPVDGAAVTTATPGVVGGGTTATRVGARYDAARRRYVLSGAVSVNDSAVLTLAIRDPRAAYVAALGDALRERGIAVRDAAAPAPTPVRKQVPDAPPADPGAAGPRATDPGVTDPRRAGTSDGADTLAVLTSPPLRDVLPWLEKPSQNQIAEALFRTVALERAGAGTPDSARAVVGRQLRAWGVTPERDAVVRDGSGLSRHDYVTPEALVRILDAVRRRPDFRAFYDALPVAGVDGTLRGRMRGTAAAGNARAKTGTVDKSRTLSGYVTTRGGDLLVFSLLCNNYTVPTREVERVQDAIVARLAELPAGPAASAAATTAARPR